MWFPRNSLSIQCCYSSIWHILRQRYKDRSVSTSQYFDSYIIYSVCDNTLLPFLPIRTQEEQYIWLKIDDTIRNLRAGAADMRLRRANNGQLVADENNDDELLEAVDDYERRDTVDPPYTDGAVEEADPDRYITPPIIRPATRPDQLRLSYMDELAPLTKEDYRPAPPV